MVVWLSQVASAHNPSNGILTLSNRPTLLITRPETQAREFVRALERRAGRSIETVYSPLTKIVPLDAEIDLTGVSHLLFTSANGVEQLANRVEERGIPALCVGATTTNSARSAGFEATSADGTATDLLQLALAQHQVKAGRILHVGGKEISFDLAGSLASQGVNADRLVLYRQIPLALNDVAHTVLMTTPVMAPVFSMRGAKAISQEVENIPVLNISLVCISSEIAAILAALPNSAVLLAERPDRAEMITALLRLI